MTGVNGKAKNNGVFLNVRLASGHKTVRVSLANETTASDVVHLCKEKLRLDSDYLLAADFNGYEKHFNAQERLYHLVKKHILNAGLDERVQFFLRKKKKQPVSCNDFSPGCKNENSPGVVSVGQLLAEIDVDDAFSTCQRRSSASTIASSAQNCEQGRLLLCESTNSLCTLNERDSVSCFHGEHMQSSASLSDLGKATQEPTEERRDSFRPAKMAANQQLSGGPFDPLHLNSMSYADLAQLAARQKQQIDFNNTNLAYKETRLGSLRNQQKSAQISQEEHSALAVQLHQLRQQVKAEETQLQVLRRVREEIDYEKRRSAKVDTDLQNVQRLFAEKETQLKEAAGRVQQLMHQLDNMRRRRVLLSKENELKRLESAVNECNQTRGAIVKNFESNGVQIASFAQQQRPRAAIEPFKIVPPSIAAGLSKNDGIDYRHSKGFVAAFTAMEEVLQQTEMAPNKSESDKNFGRTTPSNFVAATSTTSTVDAVPAQPNYAAPSSADFLPQPVIPKVNVSINRRFLVASASPVSDEQQPPPDLIPLGEKMAKLTISDSEMPAQNSGKNERVRSTSILPMEENHQHADADNIFLRNDTLRAAKRRSWAENHGPTTDEAEHIRLLLNRAQQRGRSSLNLSWIFEQIPNQNSMNPAFKDGDTSDTVVYSTSASAAERGLNESPPTILPEPERIRSEDMEMLELDNEDLNTTSSKYWRNEDSDEMEDDEKSGTTVVEIVPEIEVKLTSTKGILRLKPKDESLRGRRICFDPLAILLDAALEGELDLVKSCASKVENVDARNDEGITALHNAICAGHYEIVRFLVEANADVNAQDGDGWTPLHCAASCNNLPTVKFLVERGACIFATTFNDHETPADKCEKDEEGFDGCSQFLFSVQEKLGVLNNARVYGAYDYEAQYDDELDFWAGDAMQILRKDDEKEKGWWWAKHLKTNAEGYVPRNYLALYPSLAVQRTGALQNVDVSVEVEPAKTAPEEKPSEPENIQLSEIQMEP